MLTIFNRLPVSRPQNDMIYVGWFKILEIGECHSVVQEYEPDPRISELVLDPVEEPLTITINKLFRRSHAVYFWNDTPPRRRLALEAVSNISRPSTKSNDKVDRRI